MSGSSSIAIIGGGIASAHLCYQLCLRGYRVSLYCKDSTVAQNASGNGQGAIYPLLNGANDELSQFYLQAFEHSLALFKRLAGEGLNIPFTQCGVTQLAFNCSSNKKNENILKAGFSSDIVHALSSEQTNLVTGLTLNFPAVHFPSGGWINAAQLTQTLIDAAMATQNLSVYFNHEAINLERKAEHWLLSFNDGKRVSHPVAILANGHAIKEFEQTKRLPLTAVRGQVSHIPSEGVLPELKTVLCYRGYLTPSNGLTTSAVGATHHLGASHKHENSDFAYSKEEQEQNKHQLACCLSGASELIESVNVTQDMARVAIRCASRDHLPFVGQVPDFEKTINHYQVDTKGMRSSKKQKQLPKEPAPGYENLYMLAGLGSRGLCSAALCSDILIAQLLAEPQVVAQPILNVLNPNRMWIRKLLKGRPIN